MRYTVTIFAALGLLGLFWAPPQISAQNKDTRAIQLDIYDLGKRVDDLKMGQEERLGQMETLVKQLMDANSKLVDQIRMLQEKVNDSAAQQEKRIAGPIDQIKKSQDDLWQSFQAVQGSLDNVKNNQTKMDANLTNVAGTLGLMRDDLSKLTAPPPSAPVAVPNQAAQATTSSDPATVAFATAEQDKVSGKLEVALDEFRSIAEAYPTSPLAPMSFYEIGMIYAGNNQPDSAIKAFDRVLEHFGDNAMRNPAQFAKAEQLAAMGKNAEAVREYNNYAKLYPNDPNAPVAKQRASELAKSPAAAKPNAKGKGKR
jgi:TolA-binding protein